MTGVSLPSIGVNLSTVGVSLTSGTLNLNCSGVNLLGIGVSLVTTATNTTPGVGPTLDFSTNTGSMYVIILGGFA